MILAAQKLTVDSRRILASQEIRLSTTNKMPVQTRSMARKAAQYSCLQELKKVSSDNIILKNLSILIDRQLKARTRAEAIKRANDLFEHLLIREPAAFIDRQPELKSMTRFKLQELMRSDPTPEFAYTLGRVYQRFFAL